MSRSVYWFLCLLLFGVFGVAVAFVLRERIAAGKGLPPFSVYSDEANGLAEAAYVLSQLGYQPVAVTRPIQNTRHRGLLILVEPEQAGVLGDESDALANAEAKSVLRWVEAGNTLLLSSRRTTALDRLLHVTVFSPSSGVAEAPTEAKVFEAGAYTRQIGALSVDRFTTLQTRDGLPLWEVDGKLGAVLLRHGQGHVIVVADPVLLTACGLGRADNVMVLVNIARLDARDGIVYFDEYHHGFQSTGGFWGYLGYHGQQLALLPILLVILAAAWHTMIRLGPATPTPPAPQADAVDYASALARLYQKAGVRRLLGKSLTRGFLAALTRHLKLRKTALPAEILAAWQPKDDKDASKERLKRLLKGVGELRKGEVPERALLKWAQEFDDFLELGTRNSERGTKDKGK
jgi:hypothetical protein